MASGSGVVLDADGHVVTNRHVVEAGTSYRVVLSDGRSYAAKLLGEDAATDLAVLKISADDLTPIALGSSDALKIGGTTIAVGSPLGLQGGPSLSVGVLSAIGREVQTDQQTILYGMLQTDAAINEGSSGGALVDEQGHLVGITTAVGVSSVGIEGVGFATPVEIVKRVADELIAKGAATTAGLGISGTTAYRDLSDGGQAPTGVEIGQVQTGAAADKAGLKESDVITHVDGVAVDTMDELVSSTSPPRRRRPGDAHRPAGRRRPDHHGGARHPLLAPLSPSVGRPAGSLGQGVLPVRRFPTVLPGQRPPPVSGSRTVKVVPAPGGLAASMVPPWATVRSRAIARPRPDPPDPGVFTKRSKTCSRSRDRCPARCRPPRARRAPALRTRAPSRARRPACGGWRC